MVSERTHKNAFDEIRKKQDTEKRGTLERIIHEHEAYVKPFDKMRTDEIWSALKYEIHHRDGKQLNPRAQKMHEQNIGHLIEEIKMRSETDHEIYQGLVEHSISEMDEFLENISSINELKTKEKIGLHEKGQPEFKDFIQRKEKFITIIDSQIKVLQTVFAGFSFSELAEHISQLEKTKEEISRW